MCLPPFKRKKSSRKKRIFQQLNLLNRLEAGASNKLFKFYFESNASRGCIRYFTDKSVKRSRKSAGKGDQEKLLLTQLFSQIYERNK